MSFLVQKKMGRVETVDLWVLIHIRKYIVTWRKELLSGSNFFKDLENVLVYSLWKASTVVLPVYVLCMAVSYFSLLPKLRVSFLPSQSFLTYP